MIKQVWEPLCRTNFYKENSMCKRKSTRTHYPFIHLLPLPLLLFLPFSSHLYNMLFVSLFIYFGKFEPSGVSLFFSLVVGQWCWVAVISLYQYIDQTNECGYKLLVAKLSIALLWLLRWAGQYSLRMRCQSTGLGELANIPLEWDASSPLGCRLERHEMFCSRIQCISGLRIETTIAISRV